MIEEIIETLQKNEWVRDYEVQQWVEEETATFLRVKVQMMDDTQLFIRELLFAGGSKYSYHWQTPEGKLLSRWDNAPHWNDVPTSPHHKHLAGRVLPSHRVAIEDVLEEIRKQAEEKING